MNFRIDFMSMPLHIRKARFRQFQILAFSKGIIWGSHRTTPYPISRLNTFHPSMVAVLPGFGREWQMFSSSEGSHPIIDIKEAFKLLKEYKPDETTKVNQRTVQSPYEATATASYTFPSSLTGTVIGTTVRGY